MNWIELGNTIVNFDALKYIMINVDEQSDIYALRFHFANDNFLETKFADKKDCDEYFTYISSLLKNGQNNLGVASQNSE